MAPASQVLAEGFFQTTQQEMCWSSDLPAPQQQASGFEHQEKLTQHYLQQHDLHQQAGQMKRLQMQAEESRRAQELRQRRLQQLQARQEHRLQELQREQADKQLLQVAHQQSPPPAFEQAHCSPEDSHVTFGLEYKSNQEAILDLLNKLPAGGRKTNSSTQSSTPQTSPSTSPAYVPLNLVASSLPLAGHGLRAPPGLCGPQDGKCLSKAPLSPPPGNLNFSKGPGSMQLQQTQCRLQRSLARPRPEEIEASIDTSNIGFWGVMTPATTTASCMTPEESRSAKGADDGEASSGSTDVDAQVLELAPARTTLMVRNVPVMYTQNDLVEEWKDHGNFDFLYLPRTAAGKTNLSYAFINFSSDYEAEAFQAAWHKKRLTRYASRKALNVSFAEVQGLEANLMQLRKKRSRCPDATQCEPLVRIGGVFVSLPSALEAFA